MADLLDAIVRHQVYLGRYSTSVANRLIALLNRSEPDLLAALQSAIERLPPESFTIERLEAVLTSVRSMRNSLYSQVHASAADEIQRFAVHEAAFNLRMVQSAASSAGIQAVFSAVAPEQVYAAAMSRPFQGVVLREALQGVEAATARRVRDAIRMGFVEGKTIPQIVRDIKGTRANRYADGLLDWERRDIDAVVRTAITHTANVARQEFYAENDDIIDRWLFVATLDSRTTLTCASLSGKTFPIGKGPMPPRHYRCLPGDSLVLPRSAVTGAYKRWFDGEVVVFKTAGGREFTSTPNHPILTRCGWVPSGCLNVGDDVICDIGGEWGRVANGDHQDVPARIEDVVSAFFASSKMRPVPVPLSAEDFHGDGAGSEVAVVATDGLLRDGLYASVGEHSCKDGLVGRSSSALSPFVRYCSDKKRAFLRSSAARGGIRLRNYFFSLVRASATHSRELLFGPIPELYTPAFENESDCIDRHSGAIKNPSHSNAGLEQVGDLRFCNSDGCGAANFRAELAGRRVSVVGEQDSFDHLVGDVVLLGDGQSRHPAIEHFQNRAGVQMVLHTSNSDATALEKLGNGADADATLVAEILSGSTCEVASDKIISVSRREFSGHVFNLETVDGWYSADGIVTHNCRSSSIPLLKGQTQLFGTRASSGGQIDANTSFTTWLRKQPVAVQDEILGAQRGQMFRANKIEVDRFTDSRGRVYNLDELRRRDESLFDGERLAA